MLHYVADFVYIARPASVSLVETVGSNSNAGSVVVCVLTSMTTLRSPCWYDLCWFVMLPTRDPLIGRMRTVSSEDSYIWRMLLREFKMAKRELNITARAGKPQLWFLVFVTYVLGEAWPL